MGGSASLCAADVAVVMGRNRLENAVWGYPARASVTARYVLLLKHIIQAADELLAHWREIIGLVFMKLNVPEWMGIQMLLLRLIFARVMV